MYKYPFYPIKILTLLEAHNVELHLTYSGFRRSTNRALQVEIVPGTEACPPLFYVLLEDGKWHKHAISSDIIMYLLKHSINMSTDGDQPSVRDAEDFNDV